MSASEVTREMSVYVTEAFYAYEAVRDARDEALVRVQELTDQVEQARRIAASLESEVAKVRELHRRVPLGDVASYCQDCSELRNAIVWWPCRTARAVYLT